MIGPPLFVSSQRDGRPSAAAGTRMTAFIVRGSFRFLGRAASGPALVLRVELGEPLLRGRRRRTFSVLLDDLPVLLGGALEIAHRLQRAPRPEHGLRGLLRELVEHLDLEELRQRRLVLLGREVHSPELEVRARRECALVERDRAVERALRLARAVEVRESAPAGELGLGQVLEIGLRLRQGAEGVERALPVPELAAREAEAEEGLGHDLVPGGLLPHALEARAGRVVLLLAELGFAQEEERLVEERALRVARDELGEPLLRARRIVALQARVAGLVERPVARGVRGDP